MRKVKCPNCGEKFTAGDRWVKLEDIIGSSVVSEGAADVIRQAVDDMVAKGIIGERNRWQAVEYMAAEYLSGLGRSSGMWPDRTSEG